MVIISILSHLTRSDNWGIVETVMKVNCPSEFVDRAWPLAEINMLPTTTAIPADLTSDRLLYPRDRPRNVITGRNPQRAEYQTRANSPLKPPLTIVLRRPLLLFLLSSLLYPYSKRATSALTLQLYTIFVLKAGIWEFPLR